MLIVEDPIVTVKCRTAFTLILVQVHWKVSHVHLRPYPSY